MKKIFVIAAFLSPVIVGFSQEDNWLSFPIENNDSIVTVTELDYDAEDGELILNQDDRIIGLEKFVRSGEESLDGVLIDGFRVMIYFDQDKTKSEQQKAHFMQLYDQHKAYVDYVAPNYRVRVGNFRTRLEAEKLKQELLAFFPTAIVVEDKIQLPMIEGFDTTGTNSGTGGN